MRPELLTKIRQFSAGADADTLRELNEQLLTALTGGEGAVDFEDAFHADLDFGTGGLRGIMGPGTNRMNRVTVAKATQGLCDYIKKNVEGQGSVCIAYDSRLRSREFAEETARVVAGNGMKAYLFRELRPTPELSFAVRHLGATAGVVITASHNPKQYSGYKVSWSDGAQVIHPHDRGIIGEVRKIATAEQVLRADFQEALSNGFIELIEESLDEIYLESLDAVRIHKELTHSRGDKLKIVYTPLHGTGITLVPKALSRWGFHNVTIVPEQAEPDGNFPTTVSPNPEEKPALKLAIELAQSENADVVFATDPDADRIGIAVLHEGRFQLMTGNHVAALLAFYICESLREQGSLPQNPYIVKTIVTTEIIEAIGADHHVEVENTLTGFKHIADLIRRYEVAGSDGNPSKQFLMGCEESYGYLIGTHARDKDAVVTACVLAEMALWAKTQNKTLVDILHHLYARYGVYLEAQVSRTMTGVSGMEMIFELMDNLRKSPPKKIGGIPVVAITDYATNSHRDVTTGQDSEGPGLPKSNVIEFKLDDGSKILARPSGTEPKIKFYFMIVDREAVPIADEQEVEKRIKRCREKEERLIEDFGKITDRGPR